MATTVTSSYAGAAILVGEWDELRASWTRRKESHVSGIGPDPLIRPRQERTRAIAFIAVLLLGAALMHVVFTLVVSAAGVMLKSDGRDHGDAAEQVEIAMVDVPPPPEPEPRPLPEPKPEVAVAPAPTTKPEPPPTRRPAPEPPKAAPRPEPVEPARRVVGLSLESTVEGGAGGGYAVGDTQDGKTERIAEDPRNLGRTAEKPAPAPPDRPAAPAQSKNRRSTRVAAPGVEIVKPKRTRHVEPEYPEILRARGIEDNVVVQVAIDASGRVTSVDIIAPSQHDALNEAARAAAWKESFLPATRNGQPIEFSLSFTYRFRLGD